MITPETLLKFLDEAGRGRHSGQQWHLPSNGEPGRWMPRLRGPLGLCQHGYHVTTAAHALRWADAALYVAEVGGASLADTDKSCHARARLLYRVEAWTPRTQRLFAADCAERVLPLFEARRPGDGRPRTAIAVARRFAVGQVTAEDLRAAAATAAATATAAYDAYAAADAADAADAAYAAAAAAADAAYAAAAAAAAAARVAERAWQTERLLAYLNGEAG